MFEPPCPVTACLPGLSWWNTGVRVEGAMKCGEAKPCSCLSLDTCGYSCALTRMLQTKHPSTKFTRTQHSGLLLASAPPSSFCSRALWLQDTFTCASSFCLRFAMKTWNLRFRKLTHKMLPSNYGLQLYTQKMFLVDSRSLACSHYVNPSMLSRFILTVATHCCKQKDIRNEKCCMTGAQC